MILPTSLPLNIRRSGFTKFCFGSGGHIYTVENSEKDVDLEGALKSAEILKRAKNRRELL